MRMQRIVEAVKLQLQTATDNTQQLSLPSAQKAKTDEHMPGTETSQLLSFLQERYEFRYNLVMGYAEYRDKSDGNGWQAIDDREVNTLTMQARLKGINIWNSDTWRFVRSHMVADYHPVNSYLDSVRGTWDGQDHIARLAGTVSCNSPEWPTWFRRWLYAQILHLLDSGERYWFDSEETQFIMAHNQKYQLKSSAELLFDNFFEVTDDEQKGRYMSTTAIYDYLKRHGGSQLQSHNIVNFGRTLSCMKGIVKRRNKNGSEYLVMLK